jgi:hypothetical protein
MPPWQVGMEGRATIAAHVDHLAYHLGAIRQIDRATRGPTAQDELRAKP